MPPSAVQRRAGRGQLGRGLLALHRQQPSARVQQRQRPAGEPVDRSDGARGDDVDLDLAVQLLGARPADQGVAQPELLDRLGQERGPALQRLDQHDLDLRALDREHQAGQAGAGAEVEHDLAVLDQRGQPGAVEQVPLPQPRCLARAEQTALDARPSRAARR